MISFELTTKQVEVLSRSGWVRDVHVDCESILDPIIDETMKHAPSTAFS